MFDTHIHSGHSPDGHSGLEDICLTAISKGLKGIAICDHTNMRSYERHNPYERMKRCIAELKEIKERYGKQIEIFQGIEIGEYFDDLPKLHGILALANYDVILGSVHYVNFDKWNDVGCSRVCFDENMSEVDVRAYITHYFKDMKRMAQKADFDVLSHLTYIFRYVNGKYSRGINPMEYIKEIQEIFEIIIYRGIALEVNTSELGSAYNLLMPEKEIIEFYKKMGGKYITLGSDAHFHERVGNSFYQAKEILMQLGYTCYYYYKERKCMEVEMKTV